MSKLAAKRNVFPMMLIIAGAAFTALCVGFFFEDADSSQTSPQISRLRGDSADIYTQEALRKAFITASLPR